MKTKNLIIGLTVLCLLLFVSSTAWATLLTAEQMYLDPSLVPEDYYDYEDQPTGYTVLFHDVQRLQVLPPLQESGNDYYFTPTVDYTGDITGTDGSITFDRAGPYFVLATYTDDSSEFFDFGIGGFTMLAHVGKPATYKWRKMKQPKGGDTTMVDPTIPKSPHFAGSGDVNDELTDWDDVTKELLKLTNAHVELCGHGGPEKFYWNSNLVLNDCTPETDAWLESMKGHINNLTFISCSTGSGCSLVTKAANKLGASAGYTDCIGYIRCTNEWYINNDGTLKVIPEPGTIALLGLGALALVRRRRA